MKQKTIWTFSIASLILLTTLVVGSQQQHNETFDSESSDWATWSSCGSGFCATGGELEADGGGSSYFLSKQSDIDLSVCDSGTARLNITGISESGNIEATDCIKVWFSSNSGSGYGDETTVFCNDNPSSSIIIDFPDSYEVSTFRYRWEGENFDAGGESGNIGNANVYCDVTPADSCTYGGSGDWDIDPSDNCVLTTDTDVGGNDVICEGSGSVTISANITNVDRFSVGSGCRRSFTDYGRVSLE